MDFSYEKSLLPDFLEIRSSSIHGSGIFATQVIPRGKKIIEYVGERITKRESTRRALEQQAKASQSVGAVYIFDLNSRYDLDGNVPWNPARLLNHSCTPNCKAYNERGHIFIYSTRRIAVGDELRFNYGYAADNASEHPCRCGSKQCVGYIVRSDQRTKLKRILERQLKK